MQTAQVPTSPLLKIALSCSGGGYRAASFHLGTMSYLNRLRFNDQPLLENVKLISTVSGGTITGLIYAMMKQQNLTFEEIYAFILEKLDKLDLVRGGIQLLNPDAIWKNTTKTKNLINAFAEQYETHFTGGKTLETFSSMGSHLEAVVFNSTEFSNAVNFRFRNPGGSYGGNYYLRIYNGLMKEVKLSDVLASSSCFPGGFEPILWPDDFVHSSSIELAVLENKYRSEKRKPVGIMDGGIYDNQGIDSILMYKGGDYFDLIIISDVASPDMVAYESLDEGEKKGFNALTLKGVEDYVRRKEADYTGIIVIAGILTAIIPALWNFGNNIATGVFWGISLILWLVFGAKCIFLPKVVECVKAKLRKKLENQIPAFYLKKLPELKIDQLSVHRLTPLVMDRINSVKTLLFDVFLKIVRRLNYDRLYTNDQYSYRRISTLIKEMTEMTFSKKQSVSKKKKGAKKPRVFFQGSYAEIAGPEIKKVAEEAAHVGTSLWFTDEEKLGNILNKLVATGQLTMCYNMILYLEELMFTPGNGYEQYSEETKKNVLEVYEQCKNDWSAFYTNPLFLVNLPS